MNLKLWECGSLLPLSDGGVRKRKQACALPGVLVGLFLLTAGCSELGPVPADAFDPGPADPGVELVADSVPDTGPDTAPACLPGETPDNKVCVRATAPDAKCRGYVPGPDSGADLCRVDPRQYFLGCLSGTAGCDPTAQPRAVVDLKHAAWLDRFEVTNRRYQAYLDAVPTAPTPHCEPGPDLWDGLKRAVPDRLLDHPVVCVTASQAEAFCAWAGKRLPTEAEWEAAVRGDNGYAFPWGDSFQPDAAQCFRDWKGAWDPSTQCKDLYPDGTCDGGAEAGACPQTAPVVLDGQPTLPAGRSWFGLLHAAGNAAEWVADGWTTDHKACEGGGCENPYTPPIAGGKRLSKGGSWEDGKDGILAWARVSRGSGDRKQTLGFRCAAGQPLD
jgi:formylglycine-generating enzyme required for sulfatase activity